MGGLNWEDVVSGGARSRQAAEEAFYGFGDFFRDLEKDRCAKVIPLPCHKHRYLAGHRTVEVQLVAEELGGAQEALQ